VFRGFGFGVAGLAALALAVPLTAQVDGSVQAGGDYGPQVSPDGRWLIFERGYGGSRYSAPDESLRIVEARGRGPERELVPRTSAGAGLRALWTPDNLIQVTLSGNTVIRRPEDGSVVRQAPVAAEAWSPDGRWIAYNRGARELFVAAPDGSSARRVALAPNLGYVTVGEFSPDSSGLTYSVGGPGPSRSEAVRIDGTERALLKEALVAAPGDWAPSGDAVVLMAQGDPARPNRYDPPRAYVVAADGSSPRRLAPGFAGGPEWSPRGNWILYLRQTPTPRRDFYDLMIARPNGRDHRRVVRNDGVGGSWLRDGRRILSVGSGACRRYGILEIDAFRRTVKRLTNRCRIEGSARDDTLVGTPLRDLMHGLGGADTITGGRGNDVLSGGPGDDLLRARDGLGDVIRCGPGRDRVIADRRDVVDRDCERVGRR
jgi:Tol biopolymer transport system component